jgi:hypothetical protein
MMAGLDSMDLQLIKDRIELMPKHYQLGVGRILLKDHNVSHNENQNGIFVNLSNISDDIITKLQNYISYVDLQESQINNIEQQKDELKDIYFNKIE